MPEKKDIREFALKEILLARDQKITLMGIMEGLQLAFASEAEQQIAEFFSCPR